jgi:hypothetical protein
MIQWHGRRRHWTNVARTDDPLLCAQTYQKEKVRTKEHRQSIGGGGSPGSESDSRQMRQQAAETASISSSVISGEPTVAGEGSAGDGGCARRGAVTAAGRTPSASRWTRCGSSMAEPTKSPTSSGNWGLGLLSWLWERGFGVGVTRRRPKASAISLFFSFLRGISEISSFFFYFHVTTTAFLTSFVGTTPACLHQRYTLDLPQPPHRCFTAM